MARSFKTSISIDDAGSAASEALRTRVTGDSQSRLLIDAGGKLTWGSGSATGDATLYRSAANALKTDDTLEAALGLITATSSGAPSSSLSDGALAVDTTNNAFYFRSGSTWRQVSGGGSSSITTSDTAPGSPSDGDLWYETDTGRTLVYYADGSSSQWVEIGVASASGVSGAAGKIQFSESNSFASDTLLHWDNTNNRLGVGTASPGYPLDVSGTSRFTGAITASGGVTGALTGNADTATEATNVTAVANNSTDETVYPTFVDGATGTQGIETDTGLTYNPSSGLLTAAAFSGPLTGNVTGNASGTALTVTQAAQTAITSVGTLTGLQITSATQYAGLRVSDANSTIGEIVGFAADNDTGGLKLYNAGTANVQLLSSGDSYLNGGNVGIGDSSPSYKLEVAGTFRAVGDHDDNVLLENTGTGLGIIASHTGSGTPVPWDIREDSSTDHNSASYAPLWITRMNVTADGAGSNLQFRTKKNDGTAQEVGGLGATIDTGLTASATVTGSLHFYTTDAGTYRTEQMTIKSDGKVGIGTTSPGEPLSVSTTGGSGTADGVEVITTAADSNPYVKLTNDARSYSIQLVGALSDIFVIRDQTAAANRLAVTSAGNVGIGTAGPVSALEIASDEDLTTFISNSRGALTISNTDYNSGDYQSIDFRYNTSSGPNARVAAKHTGSGSYLSFGTSNNYGNGVTNEAMVIDYLGRVGIGKAAMSYGNLTVSDGNSGANAHSYTAMIVESDTYCALSILTPNNRVGYIMFADPQGTATSAISYDHNNNSFHISTNSITRMTINSSGAMSKTSGTFDIPHPTKGGDWRLRHSFIEGPKADLIYRGTVTLSGGTATIDLDTEADMTDGTWEVLCQDPWSMVASSGNAVEWSLSGKTLTITSDTADAVCSWMVIGERQDDHMVIDNDWADDEGHLITEYEGVDNHTPPYEPGAEEEAA